MPSRTYRTTAQPATPWHMGGHQHRRRAKLMPASPGAGSRAAFPPDRRAFLAPGLAAIGRSGRPDEQVHPGRVPASAGLLEKKVPNSTDQGPCDAVHPRSAELQSAAQRAVGVQGRLHSASRAVPVLRDDCQPASPDDPPPTTAATSSGDRTRCRRWGAIRSRSAAATAWDRGSIRPTTSTTPSDFDQLVAAITAGKLPPSALPAVSFLKAAGIPGRPSRATPIPTDKQHFLVREVNWMIRSPDWRSTAIQLRRLGRLVRPRVRAESRTRRCHPRTI